MPQLPSCPALRAATCNQFPDQPTLKSTSKPGREMMPVLGLSAVANTASELVAATKSIEASCLKLKDSPPRAWEKGGGTPFVAIPRAPGLFSKHQLHFSISIRF